MKITSADFTNLTMQEVIDFMLNEDLCNVQFMEVADEKLIKLSEVSKNYKDCSEKSVFNDKELSRKWSN